MRMSIFNAKQDTVQLFSTHYFSAYSSRVTYRFEEYDPGAGEAVRSYEGGGRAEVGDMADS